MDDLDKTLDIMERDKVTSLLQENSVRTKKNNIKFTKLNKKNSKEHLDAQLVSYERLVRNLIKQLLNLEKKIRLKYLIPMDEERELKIMGAWNTEVECAMEDLVKKFRVAHVQNRTVDEFDAKVKEIKAKAKSEIEIQIPKLKDKLAEEIGSSERFDPKELSKIYGLDESVLIDLQVIDPLQKLHESYRELKNAGFENQLFKGLEDAILIFIKNIKEVENIVWSGRSADERKEYKMKAAKLNLNLKEIILNLLALTQQALLSKDRRNTDMVFKVKTKLESLFQVDPDYEEIIGRVKPFFEIV
ncbi:MAG: hypothetical protein F3743_02430 [Nitrospinae bacterium]|nr:hypothetical protein [Nitrospinota bacterium]MZH04242.1 hypothetical protein [Nitrospinota bacterium]